MKKVFLILCTIFMLTLFIISASAESVKYTSDLTDVGNTAKSYNGYFYSEEYGSFQYVLTFNEYDEKTAFVYISDIDFFKEYVNDNFDNNYYYFHEYFETYPEDELYYDDLYALKYIDEMAFNYLITYTPEESNSLNLISPGVYELKSAGGEVINVLLDNSFITYLDEKYSLYEAWENKSTFNFLYFLYNVEHCSAMNYNQVAEYVSMYSVIKTNNSINSEFNKYKESCNANGSTISHEGFNEFLRVNNFSIYSEYMNSFYYLSKEMYSAGASSSSSGGSSGSTVPDDKGEHYGQSHGCDAPLDSSGACCYNPGYNDGILDGADEFKESNEYQETINNSKTEAIEQFKQSNEYKETLESIRVEADEYAVDNYLKSSEYESTKDSCFIAGSEAGYTNAYSDLCSDVYYRGVADGHSSFRGSNEHIADMDSSYRMGYDEGVKNERKNGVNPGAVIALMIILFVLLAVLISLFQIKKKKRK